MVNSLGDATDVGINNTFDPNALAGFTVWADEVTSPGIRGARSEISHRRIGRSGARAGARTDRACDGCIEVPGSHRASTASKHRRVFLTGDLEQRFRGFPAVNGSCDISSTRNSSDGAY